MAGVVIQRGGTPSAKELTHARAQNWRGTGMREKALRKIEE
ncbi:hypothetical protein COMA2_30341 [Candidatus Nitrospira nitrificans]|jgi:hypothetical protein|uniref:Uncharacterized protein n=1 Tax=Candidatus Nitrospira nitrificans TaxID=1742973 RepID=A0A0S4LJ05_9BACT|nr:hypothetical protein COMA2_30341 [Candidatus Nitrospira nitrificans]